MSPIDAMKKENPEKVRERIKTYKMEFNEKRIC